MVKVDLITGFLGAGKTTFLKEYARYFMDKGQKIGILENDYGAVNVDMLLLQELRGELCELEMVAGACDDDCHKRRFKTKLIAMGMSGYDRVIIEPSGLFDMDEFFDSLREEPLDRWYEIGNVIAIVDAKLNTDMNEATRYIFGAQIANSGCIIYSKLDTATSEELSNTKALVKCISDELDCYRKLDKIGIEKQLADFDIEDWKKIEKSGYQVSDYVKKMPISAAGFSTAYLLEPGITKDNAQSIVDALFKDEMCGNIIRVKGFYRLDEDSWAQLNATRGECTIKECEAGQDVLIAIGYDLDSKRIEEMVKKG